MASLGRIKTHLPQGKLKPIPGVKNIIAIASGKGGVGKSTIAANIALNLSELGTRVGLLDADIYGPNQPILLGTQGQQAEHNAKQLFPVMAHGIQTMSMAYLKNASLSWRGPIASAITEQMLFYTVWDNLDYLLIDLPPGTGDIQLTMCQKFPLSGAVIIYTPNPMALSDAQKSADMLAKFDINVLGAILNMSYHQCQECGHLEQAKSPGLIYKEQELEILTELPFSLELAGGISTADSTNKILLQEGAKRAAQRLALAPVHLAVKLI